MSVVDSLNAFRRWHSTFGKVDTEESNALFMEWVEKNRLLKGRPAEQDKMYEKLRKILEEEIEKISGKREPTKEELELALDRASARIGEELMAGFRAQARKAYEKGLKAVGRDLAYPFKMGGVHEGALKTLVSGQGVAESFAGFTKTVSTRFNEIVAEAYRSGAPATGQIVLRLIDEVGWERRKALERIARTETWKVWETSRMNAYEEFERETGDKLLYTFGRDLRGKPGKTKQCKICTEIIRLTADGVSMAELKRIVVRVSTDPTFGGSSKWKPERDGGFPLSHPNCRHGFWRTVSKELRKARKPVVPEGITEQVNAWEENPQAETPNLPRVMGQRAMQEGFSGASNLITSEEGEKIAGAMSWNEVQHPKHGRAIHINHLGADRGKGHGKKLMQQVAQEAVDRDVPLILEPTDEAEPFYQHLGFEWDRDPDKGDVMMLRPYRARTLLRALRLSEPDVEYLQKLSHGMGRYCDIPGHCFASPQGLAGHAAQTGHPVPAKETTTSPIVGMYQYNQIGGVTSEKREPLQRKRGSETEKKVKTQVKEKLDPVREAYEKARVPRPDFDLIMAGELQEASASLDSNLETAMQSSTQLQQASTWRYFMGKHGGPEEMLSGVHREAMKSWAESALSYETGRLWAWAALKYQNENIPETVLTSSAMSKMTEDDLREFEESALEVQELARRTDPTYDAETDTILVHRGVGGETENEITKHLDDIDNGDAFWSERIVSSLDGGDGLWTFDAYCEKMSPEDKKEFAERVAGWYGEEKREIVVKLLLDHPAATPPKEEQWKPKPEELDRDIFIDHRTLESWTASPQVSGGFGHIHISARVPVSSVVGSFYMERGALYSGEAEYIVATPHGGAYYKRSDFLNTSGSMAGAEKLRLKERESAGQWSDVINARTGRRLEAVGHELCEPLKDVEEELYQIGCKGSATAALTFYLYPAIQEAAEGGKTAVWVRDKISQDTPLLHTYSWTGNDLRSINKGIRRAKKYLEVENRKQAEKERKVAAATAMKTQTDDKYWKSVATATEKMGLSDMGFLKRADDIYAVDKDFTFEDFAKLLDYWPISDEEMEDELDAFVSLYKERRKAGIDPYD